MGQEKITFFIKTYGCQMNMRDSEALSCMLEENGYCPVEHESQASIIIFNTCSVRDQAERKALGKIGLMKKIKRDNPHVIIGVIGCMAQNRPEDIMEQCPFVDFILGTDKIHEIVKTLKELAHEHRAIVNTDMDSEIMHQLDEHHQGVYSDFVSVMRGCNQFCSYCIVPYVRGREKSRSIPDIIEEVKKMVAGGTKEIFLLGQNITAYGLVELRQQGLYTPEASPFAELLQAVHQVPGVERIRFVSPHPKYMNDALINTIHELPKICPSFHMPLQSGSNRILQHMNRGYTREGFMLWINKLKAARPDVTFSTDIIVGYPTETIEDFEQTREIMKMVGFDMAYIFKYSPRTGTKAWKDYPDDVPQEEKERRNQELLNELEIFCETANKSYLGKTVEVMVHGVSKLNSNRWSGRTNNNKTVIFTPQNSLKPGDIIWVKITRVTKSSLMGEIVVNNDQSNS